MHGGHILRNKTVIIFILSIIIPYGNVKDLEKIDTDLKKDVHFYAVK